MRTPCTILAFALLLDVGLAAGLRAADKPTAAEVADLVAKLGSNKFTEREAATRSLAEIGPPALDALRKATQHPDCEVRRRAAYLIEKIEKQVETQRFVAPKRIHLVYKDVLVTEAVADLAKQTGFPISLNDADRVKLGNRKLTLDTGETTFWQAFDQFCQAAGLVEHNPVGATHTGNAVFDGRGGQIVIAPHWNQAAVAHDARLVLADGKAPAPPTCYNGALRIRTLAPAAAPGQAKAAGEAALVLEVLPEPRLAWRGIVDVQVNKAVDDQGQVLGCGSSLTDLALASEMQIVQGGNVIIMDAGGGTTASSMRQVPIRLKLADKPSKTLKELHGTIACQVVTTEALATVDHILKAAGQTVKTTAGGSLKVVECARDEGGLVRLRAQLDLPGRGMFVGRVMRFNRRVMVFNGNGDAVGPTPTNLTLVDAKGQPLALVRAEQRVVGNAGGWAQEFSLTYSPHQGQGDPAKLVYTGPRTVTLEVPFTLKDVPLP
jgi:hypothetical protein